MDQTKGDFQSTIDQLCDPLMIVWRLTGTPNQDTYGTCIEKIGIPTTYVHCSSVDRALAPKPVGI